MYTCLCRHLLIICTIFLCLESLCSSLRVSCFSLMYRTKKKGLEDTGKLLSKIFLTYKIY